MNTKIEIGGRERILRLDLGAFLEMAEGWHSRRGMRLAHIVFHGLRRDDPGLTEGQVGDWLMDGETIERIKPALNAALDRLMEEVRRWLITKEQPRCRKPN